MRSFTIGTIVFCAAIVISTAFPPGDKRKFPPKDPRGKFRIEHPKYPKEPDHTEGPDSREDHTGGSDSREDRTEGPGGREGHTGSSFERRGQRHHGSDENSRELQTGETRPPRDYTEGPRDRKEGRRGRGGKKNHGK